MACVFERTVRLDAVIELIARSFLELLAVSILNRGFKPVNSKAVEKLVTSVGTFSIRFPVDLIVENVKAGFGSTRLRFTVPLPVRLTRTAEF